MASFSLSELNKEKIIQFDLFNSGKTRSYSDIENGDYIEDYNCMAHAFGAYEWLIPLKIDEEDAGDIIEELGIEYSDELCDRLWEDLEFQNYDTPILLKLAVERMLKTFPELHQIKSFDELEDDEYGIVYAAGGGDFHFGKYENGIWTHKIGDNPIEEVDCEDDVFGDRYDSKRFYFAMKKGEVRYER